MALLAVANEDMKIGFTNTLNPGDLTAPVSDPGIDVAKIVPVKSTSETIDNKYICVQKVTLTFNILGIPPSVVPAPCPFTSGGLYTFIAGAGSILATVGVHVMDDSKIYLRKDDAGTCVGSWTQISSGSTLPCNCTLKISDAGQTTVEAD